MLLGISITFLVIWFLLLLGETIIWSDRFRCFPQDYIDPVHVDIR